MSDSTTDSPLAPELRTLIERRASLQKWLAGLEAQRGVASERVLERVRADYESRLAKTNAELSEHFAGIRAELERAAERASAAERAHDAALDALEEARLRHAIGELPSEGWPDRERELLAAVQAAKISEDDARIAADRLRDLLETLTVERPAASAEPPAPVSPTLVVDGTPEAEPVAPEAPPQQTIDTDATVESGSNPEQPEVVLEQVSIAVEESVGPELPGLFDPSEIPSPEKKPPPGLKCAECGYTNDLSAWFCGVCGADVG